MVTSSDDHWRPWERKVQAVTAVQRPYRSTASPTEGLTTPFFRAITTTPPVSTPTYRAIAPAPFPVTQPVASTMAPPKHPGIKVTITTIKPYRVSSITTAKPLPKIPSDMSDFEPYHPKSGDSWVIKPGRLHLVRQRDVSKWATLTQVESQVERPPPKE